MQARTTLPKSYAAFRVAKLEAAGAVWAMIYFQSYLIARQFTLMTDNVVLEWLRHKRGPKSFLRFIVEAQESDFVVKHIPGKQNAPADFMSRIAHEPVALILTLIPSGSKKTST